MEQGEITRLLEADREGDPAAREKIFGLLYSDLLGLAKRHLRGPRRTLNTGSVVHEAYLKLVKQTQGAWQDRQHFLAVASQAMRQVVIDYSRRRTAEKRGGGAIHSTLDEGRISLNDHAEEILEIDELLGSLASVDQRLVRVVECRFFAGLTEEETAEALEVSVSTVQRDWRHAKGWLKTAMSETDVIAPRNP